MSKRAILGLLLLALVLATAGCDSPAGPEIPVETPTAVTSSTGIPSPATENDTQRELTILYTSDEHGWMEETEDTGGAAGLAGLWRDQEGYEPDGPFLILSGGDTWTGPAISSWFEGESMIEVLNTMNYDAAAIGNHEFDFGVSGLSERAAQAEFPFLAANILLKANGERAEIAPPYVIQEVNGIQVGLIGLSSRSTPRTTRPDHVADFEFANYAETLREIVPQARAEGAELLLVISHLCPDEMEALVSTASELGIAMIGGGHCHQRVGKVTDDVALIEGGSNLTAYARVHLVFDTAAGTLVSIEASTHANTGGTADPAVAEVVAEWAAKANEALEHTIGYVEKSIPQHSAAMYNLVTDAWLAGYPAADIAMSNTGGFRQSIDAGEITLADVVGVLPFDNVLIDVELTGAQVIQNITCCDPVVAGMTTVGGYQLADGTPLDPDQVYRVLVNDFMYAGGSSFKFEQQNPDGYNTTIDWRQPVIDWISAQGTTPDKPLDDYLDPAPR